MFKYIIRWLL